ncbi:MAG: hypothetical protein C3F06_03450 [Candidatus Methanoperedenaceae archaeon]|nr:MAG: hypothetical protein C3F06_03450 [Candidatus Methanoperedenaceae archaeon]
MAILSIIACRMLEDELAYVLSRDTDLHEMIVVDNRECLGLLRKLRMQGCIPRMLPLDRISKILEDEKKQLLPEILNSFFKIHFFEKQHQKVTVIVNVLKRGLHADNDLLKSEVYKNIKEMSGFSDGILIFYGTCGHSLKNLENEFKGCTFYFLKDNRGETVEDCISVALGGNDEYARTLMNCKDVGTIFLTPMWASGWKEIFHENSFSSSAVDKDDLKRYGRAAKINIGLSFDPDFTDNVRRFADFFNMKIIELHGSLKIADQSYKDSKKGVVKK